MLARTFDQTIVDNALAHAAANEAKALRQIHEIRDAQRRWHLVQIHIPSFKFASGQLKRAGYELYAPMIRYFQRPDTSKLSRIQRRNRHLFGKEKLLPFFGSYRFVCFDAERDPWHDLFKVLGVQGIGIKNNLPVPMPDTFIANLKAQEINGAIPGSTPVKALMFSVGDVGRINDGPFIGFEGPVERVDERGRIRLLLELFGRLVPKEFSADEVDKVGKS